jgi:4-amino-4-deoxy-L-arabinose transferase-like glycosyltransferase
VSRLSLRIFAATLVACGVFPLANILSDGHAAPWYGAAVREWSERGLLILGVATLVSFGMGGRVDHLLARLHVALLRPSPRVVAIGFACIAFGASLFVALWSFAGQPFGADEMAQQWHARILATGRLAAQPESLREFFNTWPVLDRDGRWYSQYPIGGPAFIAFGVLVGAPWLTNPVLLALATVALYRFLALAFDETIARTSTLLFVASPMVLVMGGSQMNHVPALAFTMIALWALARWDRADHPGEQRRAAVTIGLAVGIVALVRPLDAAVVAIVVGGFQAVRVRAVPSRWRSVAAQVLAGTIPIALLLWANARTTGSPLVFGYEALNGPGHGWGFHVDPSGDAHTPLRGLTLASGYLLRLSLYLFEWPLPGVLVVVVGMAALKRPTRWDMLLAALAAGVVVAYGAYWFDGFFAGPRFLFTAVPAFVLFAARAPAAVAEAAVRPAVRRVAMLMLPVCVATAWLGPWGVSSASSRVALYRSQRTKQKTDIEAQVARAGLRNALVFVNEGWRGTLEARLRVLGASQFLADRVLNTLDACAIQTALDVEDLVPATVDSIRLERIIARARAFGGVARPVPNLSADQAIAIVPGSAPTPVCRAEFSRYSLGTMPYATFLARQTLAADGRVGGNVVYARDLGQRNERLRDRFGDRAWFRYRPARGLSDTTNTFVPYVR